MQDREYPPDDTIKIRCSKLGHQIHFSYCRKENFGNPCARTLTCWHPYFKVAEYLRSELTLEQWRTAFEVVPKKKLQSIVELIEEIQKKQKTGP